MNVESITDDAERVSRHTGNHPVISVIIPTYNRESYLHDCLQSVFLQSFRDIEIILIDDRSSDGTVALAEKLLADSPFDYHLIAKMKNRGVSHSRNMGIQTARGQYLFFLDSDDVLSENSLEILLENYRSECVPVLPVIRFKTNEELDNVSYAMSQEQRAYPAYKMIREFNHGYVWGFLIERGVVQSKRILFDENLSYREDNVWLAWYMSFFPAVRRVSGAYYAYRVTPHSLSRSEPVEHTVKAYCSVNSLLSWQFANDMATCISIRRTLYNAAFGEAAYAGKMGELKPLRKFKLSLPIRKAYTSSLPWSKKMLECFFCALPLLEFPLYRLVFAISGKSKPKNK